MKTWSRMTVAVCALLAGGGTVQSATRYVAPGGGNVAPYTNWATAATSIQAAIGASANGDVVLVTNGVYNTGGVVVFGTMTNRVAITNGITVKSVNGAAFTSIVGQGPVGPGAVRCVWVASNAVLDGFTLTNGNTLAEGDNQREINGGGVWCEDGGTVSNCVIVGSAAANMGGGFYGGRIVATIISNNAALFGGGGAGSSHDLIDSCSFLKNRSVRDGGGLYSGAAARNSHFAGNVAGERGGGVYGVWSVESCTMAGNSAQEGGGASGASISNSIVYHNTDQFGSPNHQGSSFAYSCTWPDPGGEGNITNRPGLAGLANPHLVTNSPCVNAGTNSVWMAAAVDIDGEARLNGRVDMGCDEVVLAGMSLGLNIAIGSDATNAVVGVPIRFNVEISNRPTRYTWQWGDGSSTDNETVADHVYAAAGNYVVTVRAWNVQGGYVEWTPNVRIVSGFTNYVSKTGSDTPPYDTWAKAAAKIQDAVNVCAKGGTVLVSNGVYNTGGAERVSSNRVVLTNSLTVRSVNGASQTTIRGVASTGLDAMRGAYVANGAQLIGFTLSEGRSKGLSVPLRSIGETLGGGVYAERGAVVANCVVSNNGALNGGGVCGWGTFTNCKIADNSAAHSGGGALYGYFQNCTIGPDNAAHYGAGLSQANVEGSLVQGNWASESGGGAYLSTLRRCRIEDNQSTLEAGGLSGGVTENCLILFNSARNGNGGGARGTAIRNCVLRGNEASSAGGGASGGAINSSIVYYNYAGTNANVHVGSGTIDYSCTMPAPDVGTGNITNEPMFVSYDGFPVDFHLLAGSPCVDKGDPLSTVTNDFDGVRRPIDGNGDGTNRVDMGAYEYTGVSPVIGLSPLTTNVPAGSSVDRSLFVSANIYWAAVSHRSWLSITSGTSGLTNGTVTFAVESNGETASRTGTIVVAGGGISRTTTVVQAGAAASGWDAGYTDLGGGWRRLTWFGDYAVMPEAGWIWHNKHGFFFVAAASTPPDVWLYANDMGWLFTGNTLYPFLYRANDGAWLWYNGATNPRWFRNLTANTWENRP